MPKKSVEEVPVNVRMPADLIHKLRAMAAADDRTLSSLIRVLLNRHVIETDQKAQATIPKDEELKAIKQSLLSAHEKELAARNDSGARAKPKK